MKKLIAKVLGGKGTSQSKRPTSGFRPAVEDLEGRALMSVVGPEIHVNTATALHQTQVDVGSAPVAGGQSVMVWRHQFNGSGTDTDIRGQRYDQFGNRLGGEFTIAANIFRESEPSVAVAANGSFVVVWTEDVNNSGNTNIVAQRFFANGVANGPRIQVATDTRREFDPSVAMDAAGNFVVSYTLQFSGTDLDVYARRYNAAGVSLGTTVVAGSGLNEFSSSVARTADGRFAVAYQINNGATGADIQLRRYSAAGGLVGTHTIANSTRAELDPEVAMDAFGNAMVAYQFAFSGSDHDIYARRVSAGGLLGPNIAVETSTAFESNPAIAVDMNAGEFVVGYQRAGGVRVREMNANGTVRNTTDIANASAPAVAINGSDVYFMAYESSNKAGDPGQGIFARRGILV